MILSEKLFDPEDAADNFRSNSNCGERSVEDREASFHCHLAACHSREETVLLLLNR